jgi:hypothetical protein
VTLNAGGRTVSQTLTVARTPTAPQQ